MSEHTPTPYASRTTYHCGVPRGAAVFRDSRRVADCQDGLTQEECEANAAFIALACNCHDAVDDLLAACQEIVSWAEQRHRNGDDCPCPLTVKHARAAIAKATP